MRLTKSCQYALLAAMYLARAGKATVATMADGMGLKYPFLVQVTRKLKAAGVFIPSRGPGGGYELKADATVLDVLKAAGLSPMLTHQETAALSRGSLEQRALADFVGAVSQTVTNRLHERVTAVVYVVAKEEGRQLDAVSTAIQN